MSKAPEQAGTTKLEYGKILRWVVVGVIAKALVFTAILIGLHHQFGGPQG